MNNNTGIYLDYNATTPCAPRVVEKMLPYFNMIYGNPANGFHKQGQLSAKAVDEAREQVAEVIGVHAHEIVFTSGATESDNLAILGVARIHHGEKRNRVVTSTVEHKAVLLACKKLQEEGFDVVSYLWIKKAGYFLIKQKMRLTRILFSYQFRGRTMKSALFNQLLNWLSLPTKTAH